MADLSLEMTRATKVEIIEGKIRVGYTGVLIT